MIEIILNFITKEHDRIGNQLVPFLKAETSTKDDFWTLGRYEGQLAAYRSIMALIQNHVGK